MSMKRRVFWCIVFELISWFWGAAILLIFGISAVSMLLNGPPHKALHSVYPIVILWILQINCVLLAFSKWADSVLSPGSTQQNCLEN
jgi:hypothetical protein